MRETDQNKDFLLDNSKNSSLWNTNTLCEALGCELEIDISSNCISIDTRTLQKGDIFIGLKGPAHNGSKFAQDALSEGAALCIVDLENKSAFIHEPKVICVDDTYQSLLALAQYNRARVSPTVIGITGSYGKTTTKEMLKVALQDLFETHSSPGNYNNQFGLPLSLANMPLNSEIALFEMGMRAAGEIEFLSKLAKPDIAIITSIGDAHAENFSSISGIAAAKSEIFAGMEEDKIAIINIDTPYRNIVTTAAHDQKLRCFTYGNANDADVKLHENIENLEEMCTELAVDINRKIYHMKLESVEPGLVQIAMPVLTTLVKMEVDIQFALQQLQKFHGVEGRGKVLIFNNKTIIDDAYNASPVPMKSAIAALGKIDGKKIAILGDMLEIGSQEIKLHEDLYHDIIQNDIDHVITVGTLMESLAAKLPNSVHYKHFSNIDEITDTDMDKIADLGSAFLFKASNGIKLHKLLKLFIKRL